MKYYILAINADDKDKKQIEEFKKEMGQKIPVTFEIEYKDMDIGFELKKKEIRGNDFYYSTAKSKVAKKTPANRYHSVWFFYSVPYPNKAHWTWPDALHEKDVYSEFQKLWKDVLLHEMIHAFHVRMKLEGKPLEDTLHDQGEEEELKKFRAHWNTIVKKPLAVGLMEQIIEKMVSTTRLLKKAIQKATQPARERPEYSPDELRKMAWRITREEGLSDEMAERMIKTIECESNFRQHATNKNTNGTTDWGVCQMNDYWYIGEGKPIESVDEAMNDPEKCIRVMARMFKQGRARDWICYRRHYENT